MKNDDKMVNSGNKSQIFFVLIILEAQKISSSCFQNSSFYQPLWVLGVLYQEVREPVALRTGSQRGDRWHV